MKAEPTLENYAMGDEERRIHEEDVDSMRYVPNYYVNLRDERLEQIMIRAFRNKFNRNLYRDPVPRGSIVATLNRNHIGITVYSFEGIPFLEVRHDIFDEIYGTSPAAITGDTYYKAL